MNNSKLITEKFAFLAPTALDGVEILALVIGQGAVSESSLAKARNIINKIGSLENLSQQYIAKCVALTAKERRLLEAIWELAQRVERRSQAQRDIVSSSSDLAQIYRSRIGDLSHEELWVVCLNSSNRVIEHIQLSKGTESETSFSIKLLMKRVLDNLSESLILVHNHPNGDTTPTQADVDITQRLSKALAFFDIELLDHIVVSSDEKYYSFAEKGITF